MELEVENLAISRGGMPILEGVSFALKARGLLLIEGPNGSGKTSLLRCLAGISQPAAGVVRINADHVTFGGHLNAVKSQLTVEENLRFWARIYDGGAIDGALEIAGLRDLKNRLAFELSAGQKRRLGLARFYLRIGSVWIMDEPTVSLDQKNVETFSAQVEANRAAGGITILSSHIPLDLDGCERLSLTDYRPARRMEADPFLEGTYS